jgi:hypothetical protein
MFRLPRFARARLRAGSALLAAIVSIGQSLPASAASPSDILHNISALNLSSVQKTVAAPNALQPVVIFNGGKTQMVQPGTMLTPAQALAVAQVLASGHQSIILSARGNATGGTAVVPSQLSLASINVPAGVRVVGDFSGALCSRSAATLSTLGDSTRCPPATMLRLRY